ncbi:MAG: hypothetical protein BWK76_02775 [Desulfobulbaceae bacterium A2]|nr:MAG: hypothetical protein BWK76_02775 [Desulfobulbaceae bacterium A2]
MHDYQSSPGRSSGVLLLPILLLLVLLAGGVVLYRLLFEGTAPLVALPQAPSHLGARSDLTIEARDTGKGLRQVRAVLRQQQKEVELLSQTFPRGNWFGQAGPPDFNGTIPLAPHFKGFRDGEANIEVRATDFSLRGMLRGNETILTRTVLIDTKPPQLTLRHAQRYVTPGGSGVVIYQLDEPVERHGAQVRDHFFPGYPLMDGRNDLQIALFALDWDAPETGKSWIEAVDIAGNRGRVDLVMTVKKRNTVEDSINISDNFLATKLPEFQEHYPEMSGTAAERFHFVNNEVRTRNNTQFAEISTKSVPRRLWRDHFHRMFGSPKAGFADVRSYFYNGHYIDRQVHLGVDIASTANVPIKAANHGQVLFTGYVGIYGNTVVLDHGQGLCSLYSHLQRIDVSPGQEVTPESVLGASGTSGMAGGDHLHFSVLVGGVFVNPVEWWDQHWIEVNYNGPVADASR